jgi:hypothetical protein
MTQTLSQPLRSAARAVEVSHAPTAAPSRPWAVADEPAGNAWTIRENGRDLRFFFITGCPKSGTHWVQNILNLHPDVNVKGEFHFEQAARGFGEMTAQYWFLAARPRLKPVIDASMQDFVRRMLYTETRDKPLATWLGDRTPREMGELLPGAPTVNIIRDGRDVLVSWCFHHLREQRMENLEPRFRSLGEKWGASFRGDPASFNNPAAGFLGDEEWFRTHAREWARIVSHDLDAAPRLRDAGTRVAQIRYEAMHSDLATARRQLFELLELDESAAAAPSHATRTLVGFDHESPTMFYRKGVMGEWRSFYTDDQKRWFKEEAGDVLVRAGYEKDVHW